MIQAQSRGRVYHLPALSTRGYPIVTSPLLAIATTCPILHEILEQPPDNQRESGRVESVMRDRLFTLSTHAHVKGSKVEIKKRWFAYIRARGSWLLLRNPTTICVE